jgi:cytochrome c oxidase subunit 2
VRRRKLLALVLPAALSLVLASDAWAGNGGIGPPSPASESANEINELYWIVMGVLIVIFLIVEGALAWFIFRYRRRRGTAYDAEGPQVHGNTRLELIWTTVPLLILIGLIVVTIVKVPSVDAKPSPDEDPLTVQVDGHQFYWEYTYENGVVSVDSLRLPVGRPVELVLNSFDVIHSWWVPNLNGKRDAIPGRTNTLSFTPSETGLFQGQCAELCGVQHAVMYTTVDVVPAAEFDAWLEEQGQAQAAGTSDLGEQTWVGVCAKCHGLDGQGEYGPVIAGNSLLADEQGLKTLLEEGLDRDQIAGYMPAVALGWPENDAQLRALIDYIASNPDLAPAGAAAQGG